MAWDGFLFSEGPGGEWVGFSGLAEHGFGDLGDRAGLLRDYEGLEGVGAEEV